MKIIHIVEGLLACGLGALGTIVPLLPTTPLLLLAAFCFAKSSPKLDAWFKETTLYKKNLESFVHGKGMTKGAKLRIIATVTILLAVGFIAMENTIIGRSCLAIVWVAHIIGIGFIVKTCSENIASKN